MLDARASDRAGAAVDTGAGLWDAGLRHHTSERTPMKVMNCPCGTQLSGDTDDEFVRSVNEHMSEAHPEMAGKYTDEQILSRAQEV